MTLENNKTKIIPFLNFAPLQVLNEKPNEKGLVLMNLPVSINEFTQLFIIGVDKN